MRRFRSRRVAALCACVSASGAAAMELAFDGKAELFLPDVVSSNYSEVRATLSPDGAVALWGSSDRPGGPGSWDIWMARREGAGWSRPTAVAFDTAAKEFDPAFSADGRYVYFFSNRPGGLGGDDIWEVALDAKAAIFGAPRNLGAAVNSAGDEWAPTPSPDGRNLLFASDGRGGRGRHDLFVSERKGEVWQAAAPLAGEVNSAADDFDAAYVAGGRALVFSRSDDVDKAPVALWSALRVGDRYVRPSRLDARINVDGGWIFGPASDPTQADVLLFSGHRAEPTRGKNDIYAIRYRLLGE